MRDYLCGVGGWLKNSFIDFPGTVSTVLFYWGCNLRCPFCHNGNLVNRENLSPVTKEEFFNFLDRRRNLIKGVVFTGGEPAIHPGLIETVTEVRERGYKIKLDTNGLLPGVIKKVAPDYLAMDLKTVPALYPKILKAPFSHVSQRLYDSIEILRNMGEAAEVRTTVSPSLVNDQYIEEMGRLLKGISHVFLQPMQQRTKLLDPEYNKIIPVSMEQLEKYKRILLKFVHNCTIRNS